MKGNLKNQYMAELLKQGATSELAAEAEAANKKIEGMQNQFQLLQSKLLASCGRLDSASQNVHYYKSKIKEAELNNKKAATDAADESSCSKIIETYNELLQKAFFFLDLNLEEESSLEEVRELSEASFDMDITKSDMSELFNHLIDAY